MSASIKQRVDAIVESGGLSPAEAHVLRGLANATDAAGYIDNQAPATEWRRALHSLVKRGLVTAYLPTDLGRAVDNMVRRGTLPISD